MPDRDTIYALSSGSPPAAIAIVRISGARAAEALRTLAGALPPPRTARLATLRDPDDGQALDNALIIHFEGPASATGEDVVELHLHGGRAVVAAVLRALERLDGLRPALAGEFTRRAFESGRIDLSEAEGLADLLMAETESQRRSALALAGGALGREVEIWQSRLLALSARIEAVLDFGDEQDVGEELDAGWAADLAILADQLAAALARPPAERLRDGIRLVIAGPVNAGKSTLLNALAGRDAAITSPIEGTTRDVVEVPTAIDGTPFLLIDTAGLRVTDDQVEALGVGRAQAQLKQADLILWLGAPEDCPDPARSIVIGSKADLSDARRPGTDLLVSPVSGAGMDQLAAAIQQRARDLLPAAGALALHARHRAELAHCLDGLAEAGGSSDPLIVSEALRRARLALDRITGRAGVEDMLDALFGNFCIGK